MNELQRYEIYNLALEKHQKLIVDKWNHFTEQGYGKENGLIGVDGIIKVLSERKSLELEILEKLK